jgi:hypothetical protein
MHVARLGEARLSSTFAWGRKEADHKLDAFALESSLVWRDWTLFARAEAAENDELMPAAGHHGLPQDVGKVSIGAIRDFAVADHVKLGIGGLVAANFVPKALEGSYGGDPTGFMTFVRLKVE